MSNKPKKRTKISTKLDDALKSYDDLVESNCAEGVSEVLQEAIPRSRNMFKLPKSICSRPAPASYYKFPHDDGESSRKRKTPKVKSYIKLKKEREEFRKQIIKLIMSKENGCEDKSIIPSSEEIQTLRYYYYVQYGIDTVHVAPIEQTWILHILDLVPAKLKTKLTKKVNTIIVEIQEDFLTAIKKAILDFVLDEIHYSEVLCDSKKFSDNLTKASRLEYDTARDLIFRNLFTLNPAMIHIHQLWYKNYRNFKLIQVKKLYESTTALELVEFQKMANDHIMLAVKHLKENWYPAIHQILMHGAKKNHIPDRRLKHKYNHFYSCVKAIMTSQLQSLCLNSLSEYTNFLIDVRNHQGFKLSLIHKNKLIQFDPPLNKFKNVFLSFYETMIDAVSNLPSAETHCFFDYDIPQSTKVLKPIILEKLLNNYRFQVTSFLKEQWIGPQLRVQDFDDYICLINEESQQEIEIFLSEEHSFDEYKIQVAKFHKLTHEIPINMAHIVRVGLFEMNRKELIDVMMESTVVIKNQLTSRLMNDYQQVCKKLGEEYQEINNKLLTPPKNTQDLMFLKSFVQEVETVILYNMEEKLKQVMSYIILLSDYLLMNSPEMKQNSFTFQWYLKLPQIFDENRMLIEAKTVEFQELLMNRIEAFKQDLDLYSRQVEEFETYGDVNELNTYLRKAQSLDRRLEAGLQTIKLFNVEEAAYGWQESSYPARKQIADKLAPYKKLYDNCSEYLTKYDLWTQSKIGSYNPVDIEADVAQFYSNIYDLEKLFAHFQEPHRLANTVRLHLENFKEHMPLVMTLGNPGLKDRHWEMISEIVGFPLKPDADLTLAKLIDYGIEEYISRFEVVSDSATKENNLEKKLNQMMAEWKEMEFTVTPYRDTGTYILSAVDDIQVLLDDHIVKTQTMKNSPFVKPFESIIIAWEAKLTLLQEVLDEWLKVQTTWMYLEPIFSSPDIQQQMPEEGRRFSAVDKAWKDIMKTVATDMKVMTVIVIDKMHERLVKSNSLLEMIQRGLNDYLEKKRLFFPRFFFLSNDELLEILSETKNPTRVQSHLRKCFEGIFKLNFTEDLDITSILSKENEEVKLKSVVSTSAAKGQVEKWLLHLESSMKKSIWQETKNAIDNYSDSKWKKWVLDWPAQTVISACRLFSTAQIFEKITGILNSLENYLEFCRVQIEDLVCLLQSDLSTLNRITVGSLIVTMQHIYGIVNHLIMKKISSHEDIEWLSQLRFYWKDEELEIHMMNSSLKCSYEYLGNSHRLVLTPLTERCFKTLFNALTLHLGGALNGPAGAGKVETIRDLAKVIAKQCVVFNCSNGFRYFVLNKFFKGLASCGAWVCFSDFDRIPLTVLSVIAQQILTLQWGISSGSSTLLFEGTSLTLNPTCSVFITVSPSYAERTPLPENLKALFRPVAMMKPDFFQIAFVLLSSYGFSEASSLARKIISVHKLAVEQLSSQHHYDFGLRTIKSVLEIARSKKVGACEEDESRIVLEAIKKVNLSKLTAIDLPLFKVILSDLFMDDDPLPSTNDNLAKAVSQACFKANLQCSEFFLEKVLQLYDMILVQQGIAIIGMSYGGKTSIYKVLSEALSILEDFGELNEHKVELTIINPKSISIGQLYGQFDPISLEWSDGILAVNYRQFALSTNQNRKWLIFDGPIDSIWMENMNTVLDCNKKLCIMSGEVIPLVSTTNLIFESMDLKAASPAVVSRCGVMFVEPSHLGWECLVTSWLNTLPSSLTANHKNLIKTLILRFCSVLLYWLRNGEAHEIYPTQDANLIVSLMNFFECFLDDFKDEKYLESLTELDIRAQLEGMLFFSCIWSLGGALDTDSRVKFSILFHALLLKSFPENVKNDFNLPPELCSSPLKPYIYAPPDQGTVFDFKFIKEGKGKWKLWSDELITVPAIPRDIPVNQIIVITIETVRSNALMQLLITHEKPMMWVGPTGTGKSAYTINFLLKKIDLEKYRPVFLNFSPQTTAKQTQDLVMSRLDKRRKGVYGPALGKKCILFIDDINMPNEDAYGTQPPIELMRQLIDHSMWFEQKDMISVKVLDVQMIAAMNPRNAENTLAPRFSRHFNTIAINEFSDDAIVAIYSKIMLWHLDTRGFSKEFDPCIEQIVSATLAVYKLCLANLLPTPSKSHYFFNIRDFAKVIQGVLLSVPEAVEDLTAMKRLWVHEVLRVYYDRLTDQADCDWLFSILHKVCHENLEEDLNDMCSHLAESEPINITEQELRNLVYCDFTNPKADMRHYLEVEDLDSLQNSVEGYLTEYNNMSRKPLSLIMFKYALEHLSRICRIFKQPRSHALLIGVNGSGKQSLTRLAAHIMEYELFQAEITRNYGKNEWNEDLKTIIRKASASDAHVVLLFSEAQILQESMLEDLCNLLTCGEVPNLFALDEKMDLCERIRSLDRKRDKALQTDGSIVALYNFFLQTVREQLHVIITHSPVKSSFRERIRKYPALINCCAIDWFHIWPADTLSAIATRFIGPLDLTKEEKTTCVEMCQVFHKSSNELARESAIRFNQKVYITSVSYIEVVTYFKELHIKKKSEVMQAKHRYETGLEKLENAVSQVSIMQEELLKLQPALEVADVEVADMHAAVEKESVLVEEAAALIKGDESITNGLSNTVQSIKNECDDYLGEVIPIINAAIAHISALTTADLTLIKTMKNPSKAVKMIMESVCVLKDIKPDRIPDPAASGKMVEDFWAPSKRLLGDSKFIESLLNFDKDSIPLKSIKILKDKFLEHEDFDPDKVKNVSIAAEGLCKWVIAILKYNEVSKILAPKQQELSEAEEKLNDAVAVLLEKQNHLKEAQNKLNSMINALEANKANLLNLQSNVDLCQTKLQRAEDLIGGLGGEKSKWHEMVESLAKKCLLITGDVLISSGIIAYLGSFCPELRNQQVSSWIRQVTDLGLSCSSNLHISAVLGNSVEILAWNIHGLPDDPFFIENGIILRNSKRWPLIIDPQGQANKWIKNMESSNGLKVIHQTNPDFVRVLEHAIQYGKPVLLENVGHELDAVLESTLLKQTFRTGSTISIKLADNIIEYNQNFKFYITTKFANPLFSPEIIIKVALLNFTITPSAIENEMMSVVVSKDRPDLESERKQLMLQSVENKKGAQEMENKILETLSTSEGNILEDEESVNILSSSKASANEIQEKLKISGVTLKSINVSRSEYSKVAEYCTILFLCSSKMVHVNSMYEFSLTWFVDLFKQTIDCTEKSDSIEIRVNELIQQFLQNFYSNVCRGLFEQDRLIFSLLLVVNFKFFRKELDLSEWKFLLTVEMKLKEAGVETEIPFLWLPEKLWHSLLLLSKLPSFQGLLEDISENESAWKIIYSDMKSESLMLPEPWNSKLSDFQQILVLRCLRPDKVIPLIQNYVTHELSKDHLEPPDFDLSALYTDSHCCIPLLFLLSPAADPIASLIKFSVTMGFNGPRFNSLSLGEDQGPIAAKMIEEASKNGSWVLLQNCHLAPNWMSSLEKICESLNSEAVHADFRLWLTSYPTNSFPLHILRNSIKIAFGFTNNLKKNIVRCLMTHPIGDLEFFEGSKQVDKFKKILFTLSFFHSVVLERKNFNSLGWNCAYDFHETDLRVSAEQAQKLLNQYEGVQFELLQYLTAECNYGGKITDEWDQRCLNTLLSKFLTPEILEIDNYKFESTGRFYIPNERDLDTIISHVNKFPFIAGAEILGVNENSVFENNSEKTISFLSKILSSENLSLEEALLTETTQILFTQLTDKIVYDESFEILSKLPNMFDITRVEAKYPSDYFEAMNTVLLQEITLYNALLQTIKDSLTQIQKAIKGEIIMSSSLDNVYESILNHRIPNLWLKFSYLSLKSLGSYISDFLQRISVLKEWFEKGKPTAFWISGFFRIQSLLTGILQNYARKNKIFVADLEFDFSVMVSHSIPCEPSENGVFIYGLFLEGAQWNSEKMILDEAQCRKKFDVFPVILLLPTLKSKIISDGKYTCPLYRTLERKSIITTTGHSTNFVFAILLRTDKPVEYWILRGVALISQLSD